MNVKLEWSAWEVLLGWETATHACMAYVLANSPLPMLAEMEAQARVVAALNLPMDLPMQTHRMRRVLRARATEELQAVPNLIKKPKHEGEMR